LWPCSAARVCQDRARSRRKGGISPTSCFAALTATFTQGNRCWLNGRAFLLLAAGPTVTGARRKRIETFRQKSFRPLPGWPATPNRRPAADLSAPVRPQWHESQAGRTGQGPAGWCLQRMPRQHQPGSIPDSGVRSQRNSRCNSVIESEAQLCPVRSSDNQYGPRRQTLVHGDLPAGRQ